MPLNVMSLAALAQTRASATIALGEAGDVHVEYYPQRITTRMVLDLADSGRIDTLSPARQVQVMSAAANALAVLLASWDLTHTVADADGNETEQPLPLDAEHIEQLSLSVVWMLLNGVLANNPNTGKSIASVEASSPASDAISSPTAG